MDLFFNQNNLLIAIYWLLTKVARIFIVNAKRFCLILVLILLSQRIKPRYSLGDFIGVCPLFFSFYKGKVILTSSSISWNVFVFRNFAKLLYPCIQFVFSSLIVLNCNFQIRNNFFAVIQFLLLIINLILHWRNLLLKFLDFFFQIEILWFKKLNVPKFFLVQFLKINFLFSQRSYLILIAFNVQNLSLKTWTTAFWHKAIAIFNWNISNFH